MLHFGLEKNLVLIVSALLAASAILGFALTPALSDQVRPLLQSLGIISCTSTGPCQEGKNSGTGPGLEGISAKGKGVVGQTNFNSTSTSNSQAGVLGIDHSTSGTNDVGVRGTSTNGNGVVAQSTNGAALIATSTNTDSIDAFTSHNSTTSGVGRSGVLAMDNSTDGGRLNWGVLGSSTNGIGVEGVSSNWVGVNAVGGFYDLNISQDFPALSIVADSNNGVYGNNDLIDGCPPGTANPCDVNNSVFSVTGSGTVFGAEIVSISTILSNFNFEIQGPGQYQKNGSCVAGCSAATPTSPGRAVTTYASMTSQPTIEDFGEAQLVDGQTYVRLNSDFANIVDQHASYLVVVTPEGPSRGLYVTHKTAAGFAVMENPGGHSTLAFSYRIVAKPFGSHEARLPMVEVPKLHQRSQLTYVPQTHLRP